MEIAIFVAWLVLYSVAVVWRELSTAKKCKSSKEVTPEIIPELSIINNELTKINDDLELRRGSIEEAVKKAADSILPTLKVLLANGYGYSGDTGYPIETKKGRVWFFYHPGEYSTRYTIEKNGYVYEAITEKTGTGLTSTKISYAKNISGAIEFLSVLDECVAKIAYDANKHLKSLEETLEIAEDVTISAKVLDRLNNLPNFG